MITLSGRTTLAALLVALWCGAGVFFATSVARAAFAVLPARALAGALVGRLLPVVFVTGIIVAVVAAWLAAGRSPSQRIVRLGSTFAMALGCAVAQFVVGPKIAAVRAAIGPSVEALAPGDPQRRLFGQLHGASVGLLGIALLGAMSFLLSVYLAGRAADEVG